MKKTIVALSLAFACGNVFAAGPATLDATKPAAILELAKGFGSAKLETDSTGDPVIKGRIEGVAYGIYFYSCKKGKDCTSVQFAAGWADVKTDPALINRWNSENRFGAGYLDDDKDANVQMDVNLEFGVTPKNLEDTMDIWKTVLLDFKENVVDQTK